MSCSEVDVGPHPGVLRADIPEAAQISTGMSRSRMVADKGKRLSVKNMGRIIKGSL